MLSIILSFRSIQSPHVSLGTSWRLQLRSLFFNNIVDAAFRGHQTQRMAQSENAATEYDFSIAGLRHDLPKRQTRSPATPVKTRGRRQANAATAKGPKSSPRTPVLESSDNVLSSRTTCNFAPRLKSHSRGRKKDRQLSRLEQLPLELIDEIFLQCLNVNLLRAAPHLGRLLSREHMYTQFAYRIYCTNISRGRTDSPSLTPPIDMKNASVRERITKDQEAMRKTRSLGLTW